MTAQFQFFQSSPHKKADFVKKSRPNMGYITGYSFFLPLRAGCRGQAPEATLVRDNDEVQTLSRHALIVVFLLVWHIQFVFHCVFHFVFVFLVHSICSALMMAI